MRSGRIWRAGRRTTQEQPRPRRSGRFAILLAAAALISAGTWAVPSAWALPLLSLDKEATLDLGVNGTLEAGDTITYEFTVLNIGTVLLNGLDLDDDLLGLTDATCGATSLLPLVGTSCSATYTLSQGDVDAGVVTNFAEICGLPILGIELCDTDSTSTTLDAQLLLDLEKEATLDLGTNGTLEAGDELVFDFTIGNLGNVTLSGIDLDDDLLNLLGVTCGGSTLLPFLQLTCSSTYTLTQADVDAGSVSNSATVCADPPLGVELCDTDSTLTVLDDLPLLDLDKDAVLDVGANGTLEAGDEVDYTFTLINPGNVTLSGIELDDPLLGLVDATCGATSLIPLLTTTCTGSYELSQADIDAGSITNLASACADPPLGLELCDTDTTTTLLSTLPLIDLDKDAVIDLGLNGTLEAGDEIDYTFTISNVGGVTLSGLDLDDDLLGLVEATCETTLLAPLLTASCSGTYVITEADISLGSVSNSADVCADLPVTLLEICVTDEVTTLLPLGATLTIEKLTDPGSDPQDFSFTITGLGLPPVLVLDTDAGSGTPDSATFDLTALQLGSVTITETAIAGWALTDLDCTEGLVNLLDGVATLTLDGGDAITCTFTNTLDGPEPTAPPPTAPPPTAPASQPVSTQAGVTDAPPTVPPATDPAPTPPGASDAGQPSPSLDLGGQSDAPTQPDTTAGTGIRATARAEHVVVWIFAITVVVLLVSPRRTIRP